MKKIAIVTDAWHPQVNGVVTVFEQIVLQLKAQNFDVLVVHPGLFRHKMPLPLYPEITLALFPGKHLRRLLHEYNPDAIHIATEATLGLSARRYCITQKIPFTTSYHTHLQLYLGVYISTFVTPIITAWLRWFHAAATRTLVSTPSLKAALEAEGFQHVEFWPFGVDLERFRKISTPTHLPHLQKPVFTYFSRLAEEKNPQAFFDLDLPGTKLIIGDGPMRRELEAKYGDVAYFAGYKRGEELVQWLSLSDVMIFPSKTDTFGLVVVEALACGIPVAAYDVMGPRDIITNGGDGYLSSDLHSAALKCLEVSSDACRRKAESYSWKHSAEVFAQKQAFVDRG
ncbi:glycosyltransferase family 1 protein [Patescibacteria group bacterium]|nr:glycosyltransferase family 1 protein [Patescibacteria group bacterium]